MSGVVGWAGLCVRVAVVVVVLVVAVPPVASAQVSRSAPQVVPRPLDRVFATSNSKLDIDGVDDKRVDVDVAILDTGMELDHPDFNIVARADCTNASWPYSGPDFECTSASPDDGAEDVPGIYHGSGSAASVAALDNGIGRVGIAAGARLWAVDISGPERYGSVPPPNPLPNPTFNLEYVIAGVRWVTAHADQIEVAHMPMGCIPDGSLPLGSTWPVCGGTDDVDLVAELEDAIADSLAAGVFYVSGTREYHMDTFVPQRFPNMFFATQVADSDGLPGGFGPPTCGGALDDHSTLNSSWGTGADIASIGCAGSASAPHVTAAAAILASRDNPNNLADVQEIGATIAAAGNDGWTDDSPDGIREPLLDVGDEETFDPVFAQADATHHVYYRGSNGQLNEYTAGPGGATFSASGYAGHMTGDPAAVVDSDGSRYVYYRDSTGRLHEYWERGENEWNHADYGTANHMTGNPAAVIGADGKRHVFYRGANGQLNEYTIGPGGATHTASGYAGHMTGDPAVTMGRGGGLYVYYRDATGQLHEYWEHGETEWNHSVHGASNHMAGSPAVVVGADGVRYVYYRGANGQLNKYTFGSGGSTYASSGYAGHMVGDPAVRIGDGKIRYVFYEDMQGRLHQYWERGAEWNHTDHGLVGHVDGNAALALDPAGGRLVFYPSAAGQLGRFFDTGGGSSFSFYGTGGHMASDSAVATELVWD